jgi:hypothetical protein
MRTVNWLLPKALFNARQTVYVLHYNNFTAIFLQNVNLWLLHIVLLRGLLRHDGALSF